MIKNILFDMGGVVIPLQRPVAVSRFQSIGLVDAEERLNSFTQTGIFGNVESGMIGKEEFMAELGKLTGREHTYEECQYAWLGFLSETPQRNLDMLEQLRREGYRVILLSNTNPFLMEWILSDKYHGHSNGLAHYFDAVYMSYECGYLKPAPEFFKKVLAAENINPAETLFLDDGPNNVKAAQELGINAYLVNDNSDWTQVIHSLLK